MNHDKRAVVIILALIHNARLRCFLGFFMTTRREKKYLRAVSFKLISRPRSKAATFSLGLNEKSYFDFDQLHRQSFLIFLPSRCEQMRKNGAAEMNPRRIFYEL